MRYISVGRRFLALFIDGLVGVIWWYPLADKVRTPGHYEFRYGTGRGFLVATIFILYAFLLESAFGATIGKFVVGIRVVMEDGSRLTVSASAVRNLLRYVDILPFFYIVGAVVIWAGGPKRQRLGDRVAHTVVIAAGSNVGPTFTMPPGMPGGTAPPPPPVPPPPPPP